MQTDATTSNGNILSKSIQVTSYNTPKVRARRERESNSSSSLSPAPSLTSSSPSSNSLASEPFAPNSAPFLGPMTPPQFADDSDSDTQPSPPKRFKPQEQDDVDSFLIDECKLLAPPNSPTLAHNNHLMVIPVEWLQNLTNFSRWTDMNDPDI
jgi:hypothetical protein